MKKITIIGAGLGGLTAGALLAKEGHSVTLLEQHNIVGGCATTFNRKGGFVCEVGLHEMDGVYSNPLIAEIFKKLEVYENIEFVKPNEFFKITTKNGVFKMPDGVESAKEALIARFPKEQKGIEGYFKLIQRLGEHLNRLQNLSWYHYLLFPFIFWEVILYRSKSVTEVLDKLIEDRELKLILNANVQYYNDSPDTLSFLLHSVAQYSYYKGGGYFIKGGSGRLSDYLAKVIKNSGGEVITNANVVACREHEVDYIYRGETKSIESNIVISNLSPKQTYSLYNVRYSETKTVGNALLSIYLGFSQNIKEVYGEGTYSNFIYDDIDSTRGFNDMMQKDILERGFAFMDYSQIDSGLTKSDSKSFGTICMIDHIEDWADLDDELYGQKKNELLASTVKKLEKYYPNISNLIEYAEVGTAKTVKRYIKTESGTAYGFKPTPKEFFRVPKTKSDRVNDLYFVGQWVIAGGFSPSIISGHICAKYL